MQRDGHSSGLTEDFPKIMVDPGTPDRSVTSSSCGTESTGARRHGSTQTILKTERAPGKNRIQFTVFSIQ